MKKAEKILKEELNKLNDGKYYSPKEMEVYKREAVICAMKIYAAQFIKKAASYLDEDYFYNCVSETEKVSPNHIMHLLNEVQEGLYMERVRTKKGLFNFKPSMIDVEGSLEEGVDVFRKGEFVMVLVGIDPKDTKKLAQSIENNYIEENN